MLLTIAFNDNESLVSVNVPSDMRIADMCTYAANESQRPVSESIQLLHNGRPLDRTLTLTECDLRDNDIIVFVDKASVISGGEPANASSTSLASANSANSNPNASAISPEIENIRTRILYDPEIFAQLSSRFPSLATALHNPEDFQREYMKYFMAQQQNRTVSNAQSEEIEENFMLALQEIPESFVPVQMLFALVEVNGHKIKAFIDSGAQATIMSKTCAEACDLTKLIDKRYQGTAFGVGQTAISGRINMVPIKIGNSFFPCSMTVLEENKIDLLIGLDTLKHHQAIIDLKNNRLVMGEQSLEFLPEHEIPESFKNISQPTQSAQPTQPIQPQPSTPSLPNRPVHTQSTGINESNNQYYRPPPSQAPPAFSSQGQVLGQAPLSRPPTSQPAPNPATVTELIGLGFTEKAALKALEDANGNPEVAASLLFERDYPDA